MEPTGPLMQKLIQKSLKVLIKRKTDLEKMNKLYDERVKYLKTKLQQLRNKFSSGANDLVQNQLKEKLYENFQHIELRIKSGFMPRSEVQKQLEEIRGCEQSFTGKYQLTGTHLTRYDTLSKLYLQILMESQSPNNIIARNEQNLKEFDEDFKELTTFQRINQYIATKKSYEEEVEKTKKQIIEELKKLVK